VELDQLRGFLETARERSFTRAAEKLFLTQPAVSLQVKALEEELGERLFDRKGKRVLLTEAGRMLFIRAEEILEMTERAREDLAALRVLETGRLSIGTSDTNCAYVLPPAVKLFAATYPGVEIRLTDRMSPEVVRLVLEGGVDFGLATLPVTEIRVETVPLFQREDVAICPADHPLKDDPVASLKKLSEYPMLALEKGSTTRGLMDRLFQDKGIHADVCMELGSIEVIKRFVEIGLGIAIVPEVSVREEVEMGRLGAVRVEGLPVRQVGVVSRSHLSPAAKTFLDLLKEDLAISNMLVD
jgi:DNA-binding transcriptional LysR family regulator